MADTPKLKSNRDQKRFGQIYRRPCSTVIKRKQSINGRQRNPNYLSRQNDYRNAWCRLDRIHSSSSNMFCYGFYFFFMDINCVLSSKRHAAGRSPLFHFTVRTSGTLNMRLLWPAPIKGDHCIQVLLSLTREPRSAQGRSCSGLVLPWLFVPLCTCGMRATARASGNQSCDLQFPVFCRARRSSSNEPVRGLADGSSNCTKGTRAFLAAL